MTISGAGCAKGTVQWHNSSGFHGDDTLTDAPGVQATGETPPIFFYYLPNYPADAYFWQEIAPTTYNFQGRAVTETFPYGITEDTCNRPGSPIITPHPKTTVYLLVTSSNTTNGIIAGDGVMTGYGDDDGMDVTVVDAIRGVAGDTPCVIATQQNMSIDTSTGSEQYRINNIAFDIGFSTYAVQRGPTGAPMKQLVTPTNTKVSTVVNVITTLLLQTAH